MVVTPAAGLVEWLPAKVAGVPQGRGRIPKRFPQEIGDLPEVPFDGRARTFSIAYRPYESLRDGSGWASEETALLSGEGRWYRLSYESLGLAQNAWRGADMIGPGRLNTEGDALLVQVARGALVIDLHTGAHRLVLASAGRLGIVDWLPGKNSIVATSAESSKSFQVDLETGKVQRLDFSTSALGFSVAGEPCTSSSKEADRIVLACRSGGSGRVSRTVLPAPGAKAGARYQNWSSSRYLAFRRLGASVLYVYDGTESREVGRLRFSARTASYLSVHGWISPSQLLISMSGSLLTWDPDSSEVVKVARLPLSDMRRRHGSVGLSFPPL